MTKPSRNEVIAVKVMREQEWAYARKLEHYSYRDMRRAVSKPTSEGGLGYDLTEHALKGLVKGYVERMRETLEDEPADRVALELADLDAQHRALSALVDPIDRVATLLVARALGLKTVDDVAQHRPELVVKRDDKVIIAAISQLRAIGESRRKLLGTDAPVVAKVEVTHKDAVTEELNAMLGRAGLPPIESDAR